MEIEVVFVYQELADLQSWADLDVVLVDLLEERVLRKLKLTLSCHLDDLDDLKRARNDLVGLDSRRALHFRPASIDESY